MPAVPASWVAPDRQDKDTYCYCTLNGLIASISPVQRRARLARGVPNPCPCSACQSDRRQLTPTGPAFRRCCSSQPRSACDKCWLRMHGFGTGDTGQPAGVEGSARGLRKSLLPAPSLRRLPKPVSLLGQADLWISIAVQIRRVWRRTRAAGIRTRRSPGPIHPLQSSLAAGLTAAQRAFPALCDGFKDPPGKRRRFYSRITIGVIDCPRCH